MSSTTVRADPPAAAGGSALRLTFAERSERGREARRLVPRSAIADWFLDGAERDPVALLEEQNDSRVPELVPVRHARMAVSAFTFFRGAALLMASDLARPANSGELVVLHGDR